MNELQCDGVADQSPRTYQLPELPGRIIVRYPLGEHAAHWWQPGFTGTQQLAGLDY